MFRHILSLLLFRLKRPTPSSPLSMARPAHTSWSTVHWEAPMMADASDPRLMSWPCNGNHTAGAHHSNGSSVTEKCNRCGMMLRYWCKAGKDGRFREKTPPFQVIAEAMHRIHTTNMEPTRAAIDASIKIVLQEIKLGRTHQLHTPPDGFVPHPGPGWTVGVEVVHARLMGQAAPPSPAMPQLQASQQRPMATAPQPVVQSPPAQPPVTHRMDLGEHMETPQMMDRQAQAIFRTMMEQRAPSLALATAAAASSTAMPSNAVFAVEAIPFPQAVSVQNRPSSSVTSSTVLADQWEVIEDSNAQEEKTFLVATKWKYLLHRAWARRRLQIVRLIDLHGARTMVEVYAALPCRSRRRSSPSSTRRARLGTLRTLPSRTMIMNDAIQADEYDFHQCWFMYQCFALQHVVFDIYSPVHFVFAQENLAAAVRVATVMPIGWGGLWPISLWASKVGVNARESSVFQCS